MEKEIKVGDTVCIFRPFELDGNTIMVPKMVEVESILIDRDGVTYGFVDETKLLSDDMMEKVIYDKQEALNKFLETVSEAVDNIILENQLTDIQEIIISHKDEEVAISNKDFQGEQPQGTLDMFRKRYGLDEDGELIKE